MDKSGLLHWHIRPPPPVYSPLYAYLGTFKLPDVIQTRRNGTATVTFGPNARHGQATALFKVGSTFYFPTPSHQNIGAPRKARYFND
jgi:hypothetical protein